MPVCAVVFAGKEINLLSDTLKCLFSHLNSPWPAARALCQSWDNPHRESRLVTITRRQSLEGWRGRESSSSVFEPTLGRSALRPLRPRVPFTEASLTVEWAYLCLCMTPNKWDQGSQRFRSVLKWLLNVRVCCWVLTPAELSLSTVLKTVTEELTVY